MDKLRTDELIVVYEALNAIGNIPNLDCAWGIAKNKQKCTPTVNAYRKKIHEIKLAHNIGEQGTNPEAENKAQVELDAYHATETSVEFHKIKKSECESDLKKIPANLIEPLIDRIITEK